MKKSIIPKELVYLLKEQICQYYGGPYVSTCKLIIDRKNPLEQVIDYYKRAGIWKTPASSLDLSTMKIIGKIDDHSIFIQASYSVDHLNYRRRTSPKTMSISTEAGVNIQIVLTQGRIL